MPCDPEDVALVGARNLDPPEPRTSTAIGIDDDIDRALAGCDRVYVAFDCDVLRPGELAVFMPEPGGPTLPKPEGAPRPRHASCRWPVSG